MRVSVYPGFGPLSLVILTCLRTGCIDSVSRGDLSADVLAFPDPANFFVSQLHCRLQEWKRLAASCFSPLSQDVLGWLVNKVQVQLFYRHFKGNFKGEHFDSASPPQRIFYNHRSCSPFAKFIAETTFGNAPLTVLFRFGVRWAMWILLTSSYPSRLNLQNLDIVMTVGFRICGQMIARLISLDHLQQLPLYVVKDAYQTV